MTEEDESLEELARKKLAREEKEKLEKKNKELSAQLSLVAMREFDTKKSNMINEACTDMLNRGIPKRVVERKRQEMEDSIESPDQLHFVSLLSEGLMREGGVGSGSGISVPPPRTGGVRDEYKQVIDELYGILQDPTKSEAEKREADKRIDKLFYEFIRGSKQAGRIVHWAKTTCPACGFMIEGKFAKNCPECGWKQIAIRQPTR